MIRVVIRDRKSADQDEGFLVGDFSPDEIDDLVARLRSTPIYWPVPRVRHYAVVCSDDEVHGGALQWTVYDDRTPRLVLQVIVRDK